MNNVTMQSKQISNNGVQLFSESFGSPDDTPILLMMGAMASGIWWSKAFCRQLAAVGRYVIRYDHRDTGRSTSYGPGQINYSVEDLIDPSVLNYYAKASELDWTNREAVIEYQVGAWRLLSGSAHSFDESAIRELARADFERTPNLMTAFNHGLLGGGEKWLNRLDEIAIPTLVIHGTEDLVLPYAHGLALKAEIPNAKLLTLSGTGHELYPDDWFVMIEAIQQHTAL